MKLTTIFINTNLIIKLPLIHLYTGEKGKDHPGQTLCQLFRGDSESFVTPYISQSVHAAAFESDMREKGVNVMNPYDTLN